MSNDAEYSESGSPILRHKPRDTEWEPAVGSGEAIEAISDHIQKYVGKIDMVYHEIVSDLVHIDIHVVYPNPERNYYTLVTSGMSDLPMTTPPQAKGWEYAELLVCLPPTWKLTQDALKDENNFWVMRWLKMLARLPHEYKTWLALAHTVPNQDPARPFATNTKLCCAYLKTPKLFAPEFHELAVSDEKTIRFFAFVPLYKEEMDWKLKHGSQSLDEKLDAIHVSELLKLNRPNTCEAKKRFNVFGWG